MALPGESLAAAGLMKRAGATALIVTEAHTGKPVGIITEADISHSVADGKTRATSGSIS
jgi:CBS domain-containing protein